MPTITVSSGTTTVSTGIPTTTAYLVEGSGTLDVAGGGTISGLITVSAGGAVEVLSGGRVLDTTLTDFDTQLMVDAGGSATSTTILQGGTLSVSAGGVSVDTVIDTGGFDTNAGTEIGATVNGFGTLQDFGMASGTIVSALGEFDDFATASGTVIGFNGLEVVEPSGADVGATVSGTLDILGSASASIIVGGGTADVEAGGLAVNAIVSSGGVEIVELGGMASGAVVEAGGSLNVAGTLQGAVVDDGTLTFSSGAFAGALNGSGALVVSAGGLVLGGATSFAGAITVASDNALELTSAGAAGSASITLAAGDVLKIDGVTMPTNVISGFAIDDVIDLAAVAFQSGGTTAISAGNVLVVHENGHSYDLQLDPSHNYSGASLTLIGDGTSGTDVTFGQTPLTSTLTVSSGSSVSGILVLSGGNLDVLAGGLATSTYVRDGGSATFAGSGAGAAVRSGGFLTVNSGGTVSGAVIVAGAGLQVNSGGSAVAPLIVSGGSAAVASGGVTVGMTLNGAGNFCFYGDSGTDISATIESGATLDETGSAVHTIVSGGGTLDVEGTASGTIVASSGGYELDAGADVGTTVLAGGQFRLAGGAASGTVVNGGGTLIFVAGQLSGTVVDNGTVEDFASSGLAGTLTGTGTLLVGQEGVVITGQHGFAGELAIGQAITFELVSATAVGSGPIVMSSGSVLKIDGTGMPANVISGFRLGNAIDLAAVPFQSTGSATVSAGNELVVTEGGHSYALNLDPSQNYSGRPMTLFGDGASGTFVTWDETPVTSNLTVSAGTTRSNLLVLDRATLDVAAGGTVSDTVLENAAIETVEGIDVSATVAIRDDGFPDFQSVNSGGSALADTIAGGEQDIQFGGVASGTVVALGGMQSAFYGSALATTLSAGGSLVVELGFVSGAVVDRDGFADFQQGTTASNTTVNSGGLLDVEGGTIVSTAVNSGGTVEVQSGAIVSGLAINAGGVAVVSSGGALSSYHIGSGATVSVGVFGAANNAVVSSGGELVLLSAAGTTFSPVPGGSASGATVASGGTVVVDDAGVLAGNVVNNGAVTYDISGSMAFSGTLSGSGALTVSGGGHLDVVSAYTGAAQIDDASTLEFTSTYVGAAAFSGAPTGPGGTLKLDAPSTGPITVVNSNDAVIAQPGGDNWIDAAVSYTLPANIDTLFLFAGAQGTGNSDAAGDALYALDTSHTQTLTGNSANDAFVVYNSSDAVVPKAGSHDVVYAAASYTLPIGVDVLFLEGTAAHGTGNSDATGDALYAANPGQVATLTGNSANDVFVVYNSADVVAPKSGSHDSVYSAVNYTLPTGVDVLLLEAGTQGVGNSDASGDALYAADAGIAQTLTGNSANDVFVVYNSSDVVAPKAGSHDVVYSAVNYTLPTGVDVLYLEAGTHGAGNSDAAGDVLYAADAGIAQTLTGHSHNDTFVVYNSGDTVIGQSGSTDSIYAAANFTLPTNVDTLHLEGNASRGTGNNDAIDALFGNGSVASTLVAGGGADTLYVTGTAGTILIGGSGHDTFAFPNAMGHDEVTNFGIAKDTLQFNMTLFTNFTAAMSHASQSGANTVFSIDANDTVTLDNVTKTSLTTGNFHFS